jgi:hypothetical protein
LKCTLTEAEGTAAGITAAIITEGITAIITAGTAAIITAITAAGPMIIFTGIFRRLGEEDITAAVV